jgi:hypothetical protein
MSGWDGN